MSLKITIQYPFHPLCGMELEVAYSSRHDDGFVTVFDPLDFRLKVPLWMTRSSATDYQLSDVATSNGEGLLSICEIIKEFHDSDRKPKSKNQKRRKFEK